jgi:hypothetical protein
MKGLRPTSSSNLSLLIIRLPDHAKLDQARKGEPSSIINGEVILSWTVCIKLDTKLAVGSLSQLICLLDHRKHLCHMVTIYVSGIR